MYWTSIDEMHTLLINPSVIKNLRFISIKTPKLFAFPEGMKCNLVLSYLSLFFLDFAYFFELVSISFDLLKQVIKKSYFFKVIKTTGLLSKSSIKCDHMADI